MKRQEKPDISASAQGLGDLENVRQNARRGHRTAGARPLNEQRIVAVPLGDFFGNGFDKRHYTSLPMGVSSGGFYCYATNNNI